MSVGPGLNGVSEMVDEARGLGRKENGILVGVAGSGVGGRSRGPDLVPVSGGIGRVVRASVVPEIRRLGQVWIQDNRRRGGNQPGRRRPGEPVPEQAGPLVAVARRRLQVREGGGPIAAGEVDQGQVVVDDPQVLAAGGRGERPLQVGGRLGEAALLIVEDAPVQRGRGQRGVPLAGPGCSRRWPRRSWPSAAWARARL